MSPGFALLVVAILSGMISGSITRSLMRSYRLEEIIQSKSVFRRVMTGLLLPAILAAVIWGFINLPWWQVLLAILAASLFFVISIRRISLENWMLVQPVIEGIGVAASMYLWFGDA